MENNKDHKKQKSINRRDVVKGLATIPVLGAFGLGLFSKYKQVKGNQISMTEVLDLDFNEMKPLASTTEGDVIRLGIIGIGIRGRHLMSAAGFINPKSIDSWIEQAKENPANKRYENFKEQDDLNVKFTAVCDLFDVHAEDALAAADNLNRVGSNGEKVVGAKRYKRYTDLLAAPDVDAVIIATPDHWHAKIAMDAAKAGKHIYVEKGLTRTVDEVFALREVIKETGVVLQLGHQGRQTDSYHQAKKIIDKNVLGKITQVEVYTNRNSPNGAWVYPIHPEGSPKTIDWTQFIEPTESHPFSLERFFRWRCWWDYGTGLGGDLLTHEFDAINQVMGLGIPHSAVATGGIYFFKDGRDVPDVFHTVFEYPDKDMTFMYSASLANSNHRGKVIMGHDGTMEMGSTLTVYPCHQSTQYKEKLEAGDLNPKNPMLVYSPGQKNIDGVTSATSQYFANRGLLYTQKQGKRVDTTHLHIKEWLACIRENKQPSCNIDQAFEEAITAHMSTIAYRENRKVYWDAENEKII